MRISDWSSDVCSSDLPLKGRGGSSLARPLNPSAMRMRAGEQARRFAVGPMADDQFVMMHGAVGLQRDPRERSVGGGPRARGLHGGRDPHLLIPGPILPDDRVHQPARLPPMLWLPQFAPPQN